MCHITQLYCQVCQTHGTFLFNFCENIVNDKYFGKVTPTAYKLYCPDLVWPPEDLQQSHHICDGCLKNGVVWYAMAEQRAKFEKTSMNAYEIKDLSCFANEIDLESSSDDNQDPAEKTEICGVANGFHETWKEINPLIKKLVVNTYRSVSRKEFDSYWVNRLNEGPLRTLKLYMPFCKICKRASLSTEGGLDGVEMEPDEALWKWMFKLRGEGMVETYLSTDFLMKPCSRCANNEIKLRHVVCTFLKDCTNQQAWTLWRWLQMRGRGGLNFWCLKNMGKSDLPNTQPKDYYAYLRLMGEGWEDKAGSAWENFVDIDSSPTYTFPVMHYSEMFVSLRQWRRFADLAIINMDDAEPFAESPAPRLLTEELPGDENSAGRSRRFLEDAMIVEIGPEGVLYKSISSGGSSQAITESDTVAAGPLYKLIGTADKTTQTILTMADLSTSGTEAFDEVLDDVMQDEDDLFGDEAASGHNLAVQHPDGVAPSNAPCCMAHKEAGETRDTGMGDAASTQHDAKFETCKDGYWPGSAPAKPSKKRKVHFKETSPRVKGH